MTESTSSITGGLATSTPTGTGTSTSSGGNIYNLPNASREEIQLGGNNNVDQTATRIYQTSRTLKIKIKPLPAPNIVKAGWTNWVFPYGCLSVKVVVNGKTRGTQVLRVEGVTQGSTSQCPNAPTSEILDFTDVMTGTGDTSVQFTGANYDNCRQYWPLNYGCSMSAVWQDHRVAFDATVQVDGTYME